MSNDKLKVEEEKQLKSDIDETDVSEDESKQKYFPVQVYVRIRPLIKSEIEEKHVKMDWSAKKNKKTLKKIFCMNNIDPKKKPPKKKKFAGFEQIINPSQDNVVTFQKCILPSIDVIFDGKAICSFAYGHTGSGKTHTMLGYGKEIPGMFDLTASYIFKKLLELNKNSEKKLILSARFAELYQSKMKDLFSPELVECFIREGDDGTIKIRGPTIKDKETGKVKIQPPTSIYCTNKDILIDGVNKGLKNRNVGRSGLNSVSSRSHAFLEFELVTEDLKKARMDLNQKMADLVPSAAQLDQDLMKEGVKKYMKLPDGSYGENPDYVEPPPLTKLKKTVAMFKKRITDCELGIKKLFENGPKCLGGTIIFVDLAGNEYGNDSKESSKQSTKERSEINKSLLSLKECIRALHKKSKHVSYRNSKLTMILRKYLKGEDSTAIMILNASSSAEHMKKTINTLQYGQLVAQA